MDDGVDAVEYLRRSVRRGRRDQGENGAGDELGGVRVGGPALQPRVDEDRQLVGAVGEEHVLGLEVAVQDLGGTELRGQAELEEPGDDLAYDDRDAVPGPLLQPGRAQLIEVGAARDPVELAAEGGVDAALRDRGPVRHLRDDGTLQHLQGAERPTE